MQDLSQSHVRLFFVGFPFKMLVQWNFMTSSTSSSILHCHMHYIQIKGYIVGFKAQSVLQGGGHRRHRLHRLYFLNSQTGFPLGRKYKKLWVILKGNLSKIAFSHIWLKGLSLVLKSGTILFMAIQYYMGCTGFRCGMLEKLMWRQNQWRPSSQAVHSLLLSFPGRFFSLDSSQT